MKKALTVLLTLALVFLCVSSALADAEWMSTMTSSGLMYEGFVENGNLNGFGILTYDNGGQHYGMFADGNRNGFGIYFYPDGEEETAYLILGSFTDGKLNGRGILQYKDGRRYDGPFEDGNRIAEIGFTKNEHGFVRDALLDHGSTYTGEVIPGTTVPYGFGVVTEPDGSIYVGQFDGGFREGYGISVSPEKHVTQGLWGYDALTDPGVDWEQAALHMQEP